MVLILWIFGVFITYLILYYVIKTAVRHAIIEAKSEMDAYKPRSPKPTPQPSHANNLPSDLYTSSDGTDIAQLRCKNCGKLYDMDFPRCPHCGADGGHEPRGYDRSI